MLDERLNKKVLTVHNLKDGQDDHLFWLQQSPQDRFSAIEMMRRINYGQDISTAGLQRFFEVAECA